MTTTLNPFHPLSRYRHCTPPGNPSKLGNYEHVDPLNRLAAIGFWLNGLEVGGMAAGLIWIIIQVFIKTNSLLRIVENVIWSKEMENKERM